MFLVLISMQNQWQELFPCMVSKAATIDVICSGEGSNRDGAVHFVRNAILLKSIIYSHYYLNCVEDYADKSKFANFLCFIT